jgi:hypothetical protein
MMSEKDLSILGLQNITGGKYNTVDLIGVVRINKRKPIECKSLNINGIIRSNQRIKSTSFMLNGVGNFTEDIIQEDSKINGIVKMGDITMKVDKLNCNGMLLGSGRIVGKIINIYFNRFTVLKAIEAKDLTIKIEKGDKCLKNFMGIVKFISSIDVRKELVNNKAVIDEIKCEILNGEYIMAKAIIGDKIYLGPDCIIDYVEYKNEFKAHPSCKVKEVFQRQ